MRKLIVGMIILLTAGCIDYQLSGNEKLACANFTDVTLTSIPNCEKSSTCQEAFNQEVGNSTFHYLPVGDDWEKTKNQTIATWISLNQAEKQLDKTHADCAKGNILAIWSDGIESAASIENGLKSAEKANVITLHALAASAETAEKWELFRVKDTQAFQAYAELLEIIQGITTNDHQNETADIFSQNQDYFEGLTDKITQNQSSGVSVNWKTAFDVYKTGITIGTGSSSKTVQSFSPIWQGLISAFSNQSKATESLSVLGYLSAPELMEKIAQTVRPQNGFVSKAVKALQELEKGIEKLNDEEKKNDETISNEIEKTKTTLNDIESKENEWEKWKNELEAWADATGITPPEMESHIQKWKMRLEKSETEWSEIQSGKEAKTLSIGKRVETQRAILKEMVSIQAGLDEESILIDEQNETCQKIQEAVNENKTPSTTCSDILSELNSNTSTDQDEAIEKAKTEACVAQLSLWNSGIGVDQTYSAEQFIHEFGDAAFSACQSALQHAQNEYENQFSIQEIHANGKKLSEWINALNEMPSGKQKEEWNNAVKELVQKTSELLSKIKQPIPSQQQEDVLVELEEEVAAFADALGSVWQKESENESWKVYPSETIHANTPISGEWTMILSNPLHAAIEHPFTLAWETTQEWKEVHATNGTTQIDGPLLTLNADEIPDEGVIVQGTGKGIVIQEQDTISKVILEGTTAHVSGDAILRSDYTPILLEWKWITPSGATILNGVAEIENNPINVTWSENGGKALIWLTQNETIVNVHYTWENAITSHSTLSQTTEQLGEVIYSYQINVQNNTELSLTTTVDSGISADPFETEGVWVTDEEGKSSPFTLNTLSSIILSNVHLETNENRLFFVTVIRPEGIDTLKALIQTLLSEIQPLLSHPTPEIKAKANQLIQKLETLFKSNDPQKIAAALPEMSQEIEDLLLEAQAADDQIAQSSAEWEEMKEIIQSNDDWQNNSLVEKWINQGNIAQTNQQNGVLQKITQNMEKWIAEQKPDAEISIQESKSEQVLLDTLNQTIELGKKVEVSETTYEKEQALSCAKLMEVGYVCPISEEQQTKIKNETKSTVKTLEKLKTKINETDEKIIADAKNAFEMSENQLEKGMLVLQQTATKTLNELKKNAQNDQQEQVKSGVEKAQQAFDTNEYGKTIYIAQNLVNYLKAKNPLTGLNQIPIEGIPLLGIAIIGVSWYSYRKWKEKNKPPIISQAVPRNEHVTRPREQLENDE